MDTTPAAGGGLLVRAAGAAPDAAGLKAANAAPHWSGALKVAVADAGAGARHDAVLGRSASRSATPGRSAGWCSRLPAGNVDASRAVVMAPSNRSPLVVVVSGPAAREACCCPAAVTAPSSDARRGDTGSTPESRTATSMRASTTDTVTVFAPPAMFSA